MDTHIQNAILERISFLKTLIREKQTSLANAPEGSLRCSCKGTASTWYHLTEKNKSRGSYIPRTKAALAAALAQKEYDRRILLKARQELASLRGFLRSAPAETPEDLYEALSDARRELVTPVQTPEEEYIRCWIEQPYEKKGFAEDAPEFFTAKGEQVRSKSEILIADTLYRKNIPYCYEKPLDLPGAGRIHPDFTILRKSDRKEVYWEHLGMMDDPEYASSALTRIDLYERNGIFPGDRLILTHETGRQPLRTRLIEALADRIR